MRGLRENKGITLIALIVTIIILLILAAVSVSMVSGSGLFETAKGSQKKYTQAQLLEKLEMAKAEYLIDNLYGDSLEGFANYLQEHSEEYGIEEIEVDGGVVTLKTTDDYVYTIKSSNGEISIEGYGQESDLPNIEVTAEPYQGTYDGNAHGISVTSTTPEVSITYSTDGSNYTSELPTYIQTGGYTTYYKVRKEGYKTVSGSITVTISKAEGQIALSSSSGIFDGIESKTITVSNNTGVVSAESSNTDAATVSVNGNEVTITSKELTTTVNVNITITSGSSTNYEEVSATYIATVTRIPVHVTGVTLNAKEKGIANNGTFQLQATVSPSNADDKSVTWSSSNTSLATVSSTGLITVKSTSVSTVTITCTTTDGNKKATCKVFTNYTEIANRTQLEAIATNASGKYVIVQDIDLQNIDWTPLNITFSGRLDGNGHKISNLKLKGIKQDGPYYRNRFGLFCHIGNAVIQNILFDGVTLNIPTVLERVRYGTICASTTYSNNTIQNIGIINADFNIGYTNDSDTEGGVLLRRLRK